ncbi:hypothetical protein AB0465_30215 [Streptomyces griseoviridis]|uniref:Secreted protein n=1 Tax=Streptomyces griseoviridis TaxID=45398 RepID=A0A3Q9KTQ4_STRGD|nr:hypothetical protein [Streptomyces griseoviridis]AZS85846.1 hypothetical protein ELQ87_17255 [Streptomyces griseoviridis]QCN87295.1 hypothetical protein DDJ31_22020 [Streptomyces griseoviridis]
MLPPSAIAGVSLACAFAPWVFTAPAVLRVFAALAAAVAIVGAAVMRRWDMYAGKQVADLARARASDEWRSEERIAELESDLDESRDLRGKLEQRLRAKRAELAGLRNEHAALLRRYATAETERATALEGRRLLEIEAAPDPEPPAGTTAADAGAAVDAGSAAAPVAEAAAETGAVAASGAADGDGDEDGTPAVFSPEGSRLFLRAEAAMLRLAGDSAADGSGHGSGDASDGPAGGASDGASDSAETADGSEAAETVEAAEKTGTAGTAEAVEAPEGSDAPEAAEAAEAVEDGGDGDGPDGGGGGDGAPKGEDGPRDGAAPAQGATVKVGAPRGSFDAPEGAPVPAGATAAAANAEPAEPTEAGEAGATGEADGAEGKPVAVEGHARATAAPARSARNQRAGHFVAPTAVAVVPGSPARRPSVEGGFDFFGTKAEDADGHSDGATDADTEGEPAGAEGAGHGEGPRGTAEATVRNEDLADVVGQEALALHKAEAESGFKPADEEARGAGQVIDLTAHDETEHIDLDGLRSAVS